MLPRTDVLYRRHGMWEADGTCATAGIRIPGSTEGCPFQLFQRHAKGGVSTQEVGLQGSCSANRVHWVSYRLGVFAGPDEISLCTKLVCRFCS